MGCLPGDTTAGMWEGFLSTEQEVTKGWEKLRQELPVGGVRARCSSQKPAGGFGGGGRGGGGSRNLP